MHFRSSWLRSSHSLNKPSQIQMSWSMSIVSRWSRRSSPGRKNRQGIPGKKEHPCFSSPVSLPVICLHFSFDSGYNERLGPESQCFLYPLILINRPYFKFNYLQYRMAVICEPPAPDPQCPAQPHVKSTPCPGCPCFQTLAPSLRMNSDLSWLQDI